MKRTFAEKREHFLRRQIFALSQVFLQYFELYCHDEMHVSLKTADKGIKILQHVSLVYQHVSLVYQHVSLNRERER